MLTKSPLTHHSLFQILDAIRDGCDVRGMYYWTLMDNIEWHEGFAVKFGLFEWDPKKGVHQVRSTERAAGM